MFASNSRYYGLANLHGDTCRTATQVTATRRALPNPLALAGYHRRVTGDRLDLLAARYLKDPTLFWQLCDSNNAPAPDALAAADLDRHPRSAEHLMSSLFDIVIGGTPATDFDADIVELEVEENADLPGAFRSPCRSRLTSTGDYDTVSDPRLAPLSNIAVTAQAADGITHCLIDGYVLAQQIHLDTGTVEKHDQGLGPGRLLADEHHRAGQGMGRCDRRRGRQHASSATTASRPTPAISTTTARPTPTTARR